MTSKTPAFRRTPKPWKTVATKRLVSLGEVKLHQDRIVSKSGFRTNHLRLSLHDFTVVIPMLDHDRLLFIWNYRHPIQGWELELPAGLVDNGEDPDSCARRELEEETGYSAKSWRKVGWVHTLPGITSQRAHFYLAKHLKKGQVHREPYENMELRIITAKDAYRLLWSGKIVHSPTVSALGMAEKLILGNGVSTGTSEQRKNRVLGKSRGLRRS